MNEGLFVALLTFVSGLLGMMINRLDKTIADAGKKFSEQAQKLSDELDSKLDKKDCQQKECETRFDHVETAETKLEYIVKFFREKFDESYMKHEKRYLEIVSDSEKRMKVFEERTLELIQNGVKP